MGLTADKLRELFSYDPETGVFTRIAGGQGARPGRQVGWFDVVGRREVAVLGKRYKLHRLAWLYVHGKWPSACIDHINGDHGDNRIANLREATQAENMQNLRRARSDSSSGLIGAMPHQGRWRSDIRLAGKKYYLGVFKTAEEAHLAYVAAKRSLHQFGTL
jgi:hypothetical protein